MLDALQMAWTGKNALKISGILAAIALLVSASSALACSCRPPDPRTLSEIRASGDIVVLGHVMSVEKTGGTNINSGDLVYRINIEASVNLPDMKTITVRSAPNGAMCGINLPVTSFQLLFVYKGENSYSAGLCGNIARPRSEGEARQWWRVLQNGGTLPPRR